MVAKLNGLWRVRIAIYRFSGERVVIWCERHEIAQKQLYYWMRKLKGLKVQQSLRQSGVYSFNSNDAIPNVTTTPVLVKIGPASIEVWTEKSKVRASSYYWDDPNMIMYGPLKFVGTLACCE